MQILNLDAQWKVLQWNQRGKEHATPEGRGRGQLAGEYDLQPTIERTSRREYNNQNANILKRTRPRLFFQCLP
jgi:hypothetical protein